MIIDLTYACSMGCTHCMSDCKPDGQHMSIETLRDVLEFLKKNKIFGWVFSGGEPFENPDIVPMIDMIEECWDKKAPLSFTTNGRVLVRNKEIYNRMSKLVTKYGKRLIFIQVTDDDRFYPDKFTEKERYWLSKIATTIKSVPSAPGKREKCLYPQGRALENFPNAEWNTKAPKCFNTISAARTSDTIRELSDKLIVMGKLCAITIDPTGGIKVGESQLCPKVATIYDTDQVIVKSIRSSKCRGCKIAWEILKENNPLEYFYITNLIE